MSTSATLTRHQIDTLQAELDAIGSELRADLGARDARHIRRVVRLAMWCAISGRSLLMFGRDPISFAAGVLLLTVSRILDVMEIGHNVIHGQYDWMNDPRLDSRTFEWNTLCTSANWKHSHNVIHHNHTNILGLDRDLGYGILRVCDEQRWERRHHAQPLIYLIMILIFELGIGTYDAEVDALREKRISRAEFMQRLQPFRRKLRGKLIKEYLFFPLLALLTGNALRVLAGNFLTTLLVQAWTNIIIFCGHFTQRVRIYTQAETAKETRGDWYIRQIEGSSNIDGPRWFFVLTGHLSHQIEHHLFPDIPAHRYPDIAPRIREICARYGIQYNSGTLWSQYAAVIARLLRYSRRPSEPMAIA